MALLWITRKGIRKTKIPRTPLRKLLSIANYGDRDRDHRRDYLREWLYGLTPEQFEQMLKDQDYKCAICGKDLVDTRTTHVDHDHAKGMVRGLLCASCNHALGHFGDSLEILERAVAYLKKFNH